MKNFLLLAIFAGATALLRATPQTLSVNGTDVTLGQAVTFTGRAVDPDVGLAYLHFFVNGPDLPGWNYAGSVAVGGNDATGSFTWTPSEAGAFAVHVRAENQNGEWDWNANMMNGFNVAAPNQSPQTNWINATDTVAGQSATFTANATDPDGNLQQLNFYVNGPNLPGWNYVGSTAVGGGNATASFSWTPSDPGAYAVHVRAMDTWGWYDWNANVATSFNVAAANTSPQTNWASGVAVLAGHPTTLTGNASDPDGNLQSMYFYVTGPGLPGWNYVGSAAIGGANATATLSWTPAQGGTYGVHIRAQDTWGWYDANGDVSSYFNVSANQPPRTISVGATSTSLGNAITLTGRATDQDGNLSWLSFYVSGPTMPAWQYVGGAGLSGADATGSLSWTPPAAGDYTVTCRAYDDLGSVDSNGDCIGSFSISDSSPPSVPGGLQGTGVGATSFTLIWTPSGDNVGVTGYEVSRNGVSLGTVAGTSIGLTGLTPVTSYAMAVRARDAAGNWSSWSAAYAVVTAADTTPPSAPGGLSQSLVGASSFTLSWAAATDNIGVTAYEVRRDGQSLGTVGLTSMTVAGLSPNTSYAMEVRARDAAGNWSDWSGAHTFATVAGNGPPPGSQSLWLDIDGDGLRDEIIPGGVKFSYTISGWRTEFQLYWNYIVNEYWVPVYETYTDGDSENSTLVTTMWTPTWFIYPSDEESTTYVDMDFDLQTEPDYHYIIFEDSSYSTEVDTSHWFGLLGLVGLPGGGLQHISIPNINADQIFNTQFILARMGKPVGGLNILNSVGALLGNVTNGGSITLTMPANGSLILKAKDLLGKVLEGGPQVIWQVLNSSGSVLNPWHSADQLDLNDAINNSEDGILTVGVKLDNDDRPAWFTIIIEFPVPRPMIAVDANRDGLISFGGFDATSSATPYRFWLNDDIDRGHTVDGNDFEQDDISPTEAAANNWVEDWKYNTVQSQRDLEDFARIVVSTSGIADALRNGDLYLGLKWTDTVGTPSVKLYKQYDATGGTSYLTDDYQASVQLPENAILNQRYPNDDVSSMSAHTVVTPGDLFVLPQGLWIGLTGDTLKRSLLFEGCTAGKGQLKLVILKKDGTDYTEIGEGPGVWFDLKKIGDMYEHWSVGNSNGGAPNAVAGRIASLSGSGSAFSYTASSLEEQKYILYVHGWNMEQWEKERYAETAYKRLWWQGYKGRFGLFSWPTTNGFTTKFDAAVNSTNFDQGEFTAWRSATPLRQLLQTLNTAYGGQLYVLSHSMGGIATSEALRLQSDANGAPIVQVYVASQAALSAHVYDGTLSDATGSPNALQWTYTYPGTGVSVNYGPQTPNIYKNWTAFVLRGSAVSSSAVNRLVNFYNENDYALSAPVWQFNQLTKPDFADYPDLLWEYYYVGDFTGVPASDGFRKVGKYTNLSGEVILNLGNRTTVQGRYEIMSFGAESRVKAFGATPNISQGISNAVDLQTIWPTDPDNHSAHKWHSAEFRSTIQLERNYWKTLLSDRGFDISTVTLP